MAKGDTQQAAKLENLGFVHYAGRFFSVDAERDADGSLLINAVFEGHEDVTETVDLDDLAETIERQRRDSYEPEPRCEREADFSRRADFVA